MRLQNVINKIKENLESNHDIIFRDIMIGHLQSSIVFIKEISDFEIINNNILKPLQERDLRTIEKEKLNDTLINEVLTCREVATIKKIDEISIELLRGKTAILIDGIDNCIVVDTTKYINRPIEESPTSSVVNGPREGFNESIKDNIILVRKRLVCPELKIEEILVGKRTRTKVEVIYMTDLVDKKIVKSVTKKIKEIDIDGIIDSYYIAEFLQLKKRSVFKQVGITEKPDILSAKILEGRIGILVDGSPIALTVPYIIYEDFQNSDDYYSSFYHAIFVRWLRLIGVLMSILLPGLYVAIQLYHYDIIPLNFMVTIIKSSYDLPFSPMFEILFVILLFEILNEASLRMPKYFGISMSIVGALILGETAVNAGLISPPSVMIVAVSSITIFTVPYLANQLSLLRIGFAIMGGMLGLYGIVIGIVFCIAYLADLDNYGSAYLSPLSPSNPRDKKDWLNKGGLVDMKTRPESIKKKSNSRRMK